ncbi:MAG TPA: M12 family metallopeptidase [Polyangiaceae bacterium]|nr:M12 family metallopeptidase [Polyangiaceae bacterium]
MSDAPQNPRYCSLKVMPARALPPTLDPRRARLIQVLASKWVNGTVLKYCFVSSARFQMADGSSRVFEWPLVPAQLQAFRAAIRRWTDLGIGVSLQEVTDRATADVRVGFFQGDGSWSYVGRDIRLAAADELTMNIGWDITGDIDTAVHEIGHTLGFPHEHQNPHAGIEWNEEAVYAALARPPNEWTREQTFHNIIRKIVPDTVQGSSWDPDSIMHYPFEAGLINRPERYREGLRPAGDLSPRDIDWVHTFYPPLSTEGPPVLSPFTSQQLALAPGEQAAFVLKPGQTRDYEIRTFGTADTVMVLFERTPSGPVYVAGDDDGGEDRNSRLTLRLIQGREYELRLRLYFSTERGSFAVMYW